MGKQQFLPVIIGRNLQALPLPGKPLIEIFGTGRFLIEHHNGICAYSPEEVAIKVSYGLVRALGMQLTLSMINREQVVISGEIHSVELIRRKDYEDH